MLFVLVGISVLSMGTGFGAPQQRGRVQSRLNGLEKVNNNGTDNPTQIAQLSALKNTLDKTVDASGENFINMLGALKEQAYSLYDALQSNHHKDHVRVERAQDEYDSLKQDLEEARTAYTTYQTEIKKLVIGMQGLTQKCPLIRRDELKKTTNRTLRVSASIDGLFRDLEETLSLIFERCSMAKI